jgi:hypothetical protein
MRTLAYQICYRVISNGESKLAAFCSLCSSAIGHLIDIESMERTECCRDCEQQFYEPNREQWVKGWRPDDSLVVATRESRLFVPR